ncbi:MAG: ABC transporter ATP-binding protein [Epulopiscium sp.]|nr:ABC transporter ATP-binding protein [Candidatus Epulonipiscium sp.]
MRSFQWIKNYIRPYKWLIVFGLFLVLITSGLHMVNPYLSGKIVDDVIKNGQTDLLMPLVIKLIIVTFLASVLNYFYKMIFEHISQNTVFQIRKDIYTQLQEQDFMYFDTTRTGDIMARLTGDTEAIRHFVAMIIFTVFNNFMLLIFALVMMFSINASLTVLMLAITPFIGFFAYQLSQTVRPAFMRIREKFSSLNSVVQENISGNRVVKAFAKELYEIEKFTVENDGYRQAHWTASRIWESYLPVLDGLASFMSVVLILVGGILVIKNKITLGQLVMFSGYLWALNNPMRSLGWIINDIQRFSASTEKIIELLQRSPRIKNVPNAIKNHKIRGNVTFRDVSFKYGRDYALHNINFSVKAGETVGIIGSTGSGKTSLVNLIPRFYDCNKGEVLIDGINVKELELHTLRSQIGIAMQDVFLFSNTIEGNIAYGKPEASMDETLWSASIAGVDEFIHKFPEGYDTIVGERGVGLSGGQKQRIALARALLTQTSILILDDTTSSVDMETEHRIHTALRSMNRKQTKFIIAHRISSVKDADIILVLDHGCIIEQGSHEELLAKRGTYYQIFQNQVGDFQDFDEEEVV